MAQRVLVTGGAGYIGSHICLDLLNSGYEVVVVDNLSNSRPEALERVAKLCGKRADLRVFDLCDKVALEKLFDEKKIDSVIHMAGLKAVGESTQKPLYYYQNNLESTLSLVEVMLKKGVNKLVFSSSATVYGLPKSVPITEDFPTWATNPYGWTKFMIEKILLDIGAAHPEFGVVMLRYFNPIGAHESGRIGEDPKGIPNNLLPYIAQVAVGKLASLKVFGGDYDTIDGTGVRDYIHVVDLADGHLKALKKLDSQAGGVKIYNLGTGSGYSVIQVIEAFEKACGKKIPYTIAERRAGDVASSYANPTLAKQDLGWEATRGIEVMCKDAWLWQSSNPNGYDPA